VETGFVIRVWRCGALAVFGVLCAGCAPKIQTLYYWGSYEELIYASYAKPGAVPPETQIAGLEKDYQAARGKGKRMPPGWHAQLGSLYFQLGKKDEAQTEFRTEKADFPESAVLMERFLSGTAVPPVPASASPPAPAAGAPAVPSLPATASAPGST
jgi:hypothetical protein